MPQLLVAFVLPAILYLVIRPCESRFRSSNLLLMLELAIYTNYLNFGFLNYDGIISVVD